jgi:hypothetical protein
MTRSLRLCAFHGKARPSLEEGAKVRAEQSARPSETAAFKREALSKAPDQVVLLQMVSMSRLAFRRSVSISSEVMNWRSPLAPAL